MFHIDSNVAIVGVTVDVDASPVIARTRTGSVAIGVLLEQPLQVKTGTDRVVSQRRQNHGLSWLPDDMQHPADAIRNIQWRAACRKACGTTGQFHDEAFGRAAFKPNSTIGMQIRDIDLIQQKMHNVRIVPDTLCGERLAANQHSVSGVTVKNIVTEQGPLVVSVVQLAISYPRGSARIGHKIFVQCVHIDIDDGAAVGKKRVIQQNRLRRSRKNCPRGIGKHA